jgi:hypothetical protein
MIHTCGGRLSDPVGQHLFDVLPVHAVVPLLAKRDRSISAAVGKPLNPAKPECRRDQVQKSVLRLGI